MKPWGGEKGWEGEKPEIIYSGNHSKMSKDDSRIYEIRILIRSSK